MKYVSPKIWRKFSGETPLIQKMQAFLTYNVGDGELAHLVDEVTKNGSPESVFFFEAEAQAIIHLVRKSDLNEASLKRRKKLK